MDAAIIPGIVFSGIFVAMLLFYILSLKTVRLAIRTVSCNIVCCGSSLVVEDHDIELGDMSNPNRRAVSNPQRENSSVPRPIAAHRLQNATANQTRDDTGENTPSDPTTVELSDPARIPLPRSPAQAVVSSSRVVARPRDEAAGTRSLRNNAYSRELDLGLATEARRDVDNPDPLPLYEAALLTPVFEYADDVLPPVYEEIFPRGRY
jgi:hypothetical protein